MLLGLASPDPPHPPNHKITNFGHDQDWRKREPPPIQKRKGKEIKNFPWGVHSPLVSSSYHTFILMFTTVMCMMRLARAAPPVVGTHQSPSLPVPTARPPGVTRWGHDPSRADDHRQGPPPQGKTLFPERANKPGLMIGGGASCAERKDVLRQYLM